MAQRSLSEGSPTGCPAKTAGGIPQSNSAFLLLETLGEPVVAPRRLVTKYRCAKPVRMTNRAVTGPMMLSQRLPLNVPAKDSEAAVAEFIRTKGVTRCPTACVLPTQGSVAAADREALEEYAVRRDRLRRARVAARTQQIWNVQVSPPGGP